MAEIGIQPLSGNHQARVVPRVVLSNRHVTLSTDQLSSPPPEKKSTAAVLFGALTSRLLPHRNTAEAPREEPGKGACEVADSPQMCALLEVIQRQTTIRKLPPGLLLVPSRVSQVESLQAFGLVDSRSKSVGVDLAIWSAPCADELDSLAWRRVFGWVVASDHRLRELAIVDSPERRGQTLLGRYRYVTDGVPGCGVLSITSLEDGCWNICDCWGDASDADRIEQLTTQLI